MIELPDLTRLQAPERYAVELLVDLARLIPVGKADVPVVRLEVLSEGSGSDVQPVTKWVERQWGITPEDGTVRIPRSALLALTAIAGVVAEQVTPAADPYGRVPPAANALVEAGLERVPVISSAARALGEAVRRAAGRRPVRLLAPWPEGKRWAVALTHDLDVVEWWPAFTARRLGELLHRGDFTRITRVLAAIPGGLVSRPVVRALDGLIAQERARGVRSSWYILCGTPTVATMRAGDLTYLPEGALARRLVQAMAAAGGEIGLHGSFETFSDAEAFTRQRERLAGLIRNPVSGVRQHFLRLRPGKTQRAMAAQGFTYDASIGFPDRNGFRQGMADIAPMWDHERETALGIDEVPVVWMDRALSKYRGTEDPQAWIDDGVLLADQARAVEGLWVGVWHPNLTPALGFPGAPEAYGRLMDALLARAPHVGTVGELVRWRRQRRAARIERLGADGAVYATSGGQPVPLDPA